MSCGDIPHGILFLFLGAEQNKSMKIKGRWTTTLRSFELLYMYTCIYLKETSGISLYQVMSSMYSVMLHHIIMIRKSWTEFIQVACSLLCPLNSSALMKLPRGWLIELVETRACSGWVLSWVQCSILVWSRSSYAFLIISWFSILCTPWAV